MISYFRLVGYNEAYKILYEAEINIAAVESNVLVTHSNFCTVHIAHF